jgi:hypothetical protein
MFRKIVLSTVAALGLLAAFALPTLSIDAHPRYAHPARGHAHYRTYTHRQFGCWADANNWMRRQRAHGFECYHEWHGPQCWVFYR